MSRWPEYKSVSFEPREFPVDRERMFRDLARRTLLSWWFIPVVCVFGWPFAYLMGGFREANLFCAEISSDLWNGI